MRVVSFGHKGRLFLRTLPTGLSSHHNFMQRLGIVLNQGVFHFSLNRREQLLKRLLCLVMLLKPESMGLDVQLHSHVHEGVVHLFLHLQYLLLLLFVFQLLVLLLTN